MATAAQLHVKLSAKDAASLRKIARVEQISLSETIRRLIRRERLRAGQLLLDVPS